ncbi:ABC transporter substrate-binding protein [Arthrobacter pascens]|uniref:ABC transporter substrate-binding protein n=1 Tax=Arthrobacter pascens TaxID=1677 RepID=UPI00196B3748|nr:ABC transporter substrate-binding protein [Arthrobacter pascens]MBN3499708.1 ABC transporter substrate-binding protein [Arthrobacter pascens]
MQLSIRKSLAAVSVLAALSLTACAGASSGAASKREGGLAQIDVAVLEAPSLTSFYAPVIKSQEFDRKNGLDLKFTPKSATTLRTEVANGSVQVSAGATVLTDVALLNQQGSNVRYLFNAFDWWGTVVTPTGSDINSLKDFDGKKIVGALSTTNYAMFKITAGLAGNDVGSFQENSAEPAGLVAAAKSGREKAVQLWEPAHTVLTSGNSNFRSIDLVKEFKAATDTHVIPYVGVAVQAKWLENNGDLVQPLYDTFKDAAAYVAEHPDEAAKLIAEDTGIGVDVLKSLLTSDRFGMSVYPAKDAANELNIILNAAAKYGVLKSAPDLDGLLAEQEITK